jgi:hypothetical protein
MYSLAEQLPSEKEENFRDFSEEAKIAGYRRDADEGIVRTF